MIQPIHNIPAPPPAIVQSQSQQPPAGPSPASSQPIQSMNSMMQQRPDCRLAQTIVASVSGQGSAGVVYPSCMVGSNSHTGHMEQPDLLNYEPYIWSF